MSANEAACGQRQSADGPQERGPWVPDSPATADTGLERLTSAL